MSTTTSIEKLPANISHLEPNGSNWAIFTLCFWDTMKVTCCWAYFTSLKAQSSPPIDEDNPTKEKVEAIEKWEYEDSVASYLLSQHLLDTTVDNLGSRNMQ